MNAEALTEFSVALRKALSAYRFYPPGHAKVNEFNETLKACLTTLGGIALEVTIAGLLCGETVLLEGESVKDAPTRPLFLEGILRINIAGEVPLAELAELLRLWHLATIRQLPSGQSLSTLLWDASFKRIDFEFAEMAGIQDFSDAEVEREEKRKKIIDGLLKQMTANKGTKQTRPTDFSVQRGQFEDLTGLDLSHAGDFILPVPLSLAERQQLATELRAEDTSEAVRLAFAAWEVFEAAIDNERALVAKWFATALSRLRDEPLTRVTDVVRRLGLAARQGSSGERLVDWLSTLVKEPWSALLLAKLEQEGTAREVEELLPHLPRALVDGLVGLLPKLKSNEVRGRLISQFTARHVHVISLAGLAPTLKPADLAWLRQLFDTAPDGKLLLGELFRGGPAGLKLAFLEQLPAASFVALKPALLASLEAPDPKERLAAAKKIVELKIPAAEAPVTRALLSAVGTPEAQAWMGLLAGYETLAALEGLSSYFTLEKDLDLRIACARVLGQVGSPRALPLLTRSSAGLFTNRRLKAACSEAIKSIQKGMT